MSPFEVSEARHLQESGGGHAGTDTAAASAVQHAGEGASGHAAQAHAAQGHGAGGEGGVLSPEEMFHHVSNSQEIDLGFTTFHLPEMDPIHVAGLAIDLSITRHVVFLFIAAVLTVITMWFAATRAQRLEQGKKAPGGLLNAIEAFYLYFRDDVAMANIGRGGERFVPFVVTLFFFILYANLLGLVPFGATATSNIMVTGALAFISLLVIEISGFQALGPRGYMKTIFFVPEGLPAPMKVVMYLIMPLVEVVGKLAKPFALAVRLFANMTAGHFVLLVLLGLIVAYGSFTQVTGFVGILGSILLALFVMFLEIFVAFLQAYIFAMLTAVFIGLIRHAH